MDEIFLFRGLLRVLNFIAWAFCRLDVILFEIFDVTFIVMNWLSTADTDGNELL